MDTFESIIAKRMYNEMTGEPLTFCTVCRQAWRPGDYLFVAKAYSGGRCAMAGAQCHRCQNDMDEISEQSMENLSLYSGRRLRAFVDDRLERKIYHQDDPLCLVTRENIDPRGNFELYTLLVPQLASENELNYFFIGGTAMEQMSELLSEQTRKTWEDFLKRIQPQTPETVISPMFMG